MLDLTYALAEEIGHPDLFVGREKELARLMKWADGTKRRISLGTLRVTKNYLKPKELKKALQLINENHDDFERTWDEWFSR